MKFKNSQVIFWMVFAFAVWHVHRRSDAACNLSIDLFIFQSGLSYAQCCFHHFLGILQQNA